MGKTALYDALIPKTGIPKGAKAKAHGMSKVVYRK
jgi:hypothetical protein